MRVTAPVVRPVRSPISPAGTEPVSSRMLRQRRSLTCRPSRSATAWWNKMPSVAARWAERARSLSMRARPGARRADLVLDIDAPSMLYYLNGADNERLIYCGVQLMLDDRKDGAMSTRPRPYGGLLALLETTSGRRLDHAPTRGRA